MTRQEAEALVAKFSQIWEPVTASWSYGIDSFHMDGFIGEGDKAPSFDIHIEEAGNGSVRCGIGQGHWVHLRADMHGQITKVCWLPIDAYTFFDEYDAYFRRCAYLSGCPIEASAHEQLEWTQQFHEQQAAQC